MGAEHGVHAVGEGERGPAAPCHGASLCPERCHRPAAVCKDVLEADIAFLVDGSSSIGWNNFRAVRTFMEDLVVPFVQVVGEKAVRFAVAQYSDEPR